MCWATLCLVRCVLVEKIVGGLSYVFTKLLQLFDVFAGGILLPGDDEPFMFNAVLGGVLADLVGHQALTAWKGPNAIRACTRCANLNTRRAGKSDTEVDLTDHDDRLFLAATDEEIYLLIDNLQTLVESGALGSTAQDKLETELGFNHEPHGILLDRAMRGTYSPTQHPLTDWMHTFCQDGVASVEMALLLKRLASHHQPPVTNPMVQTFINECTGPLGFAKVEGIWVESKRLKGKALKAFSSMVIGLVPCLALLLTVYDVASQLPEEVECFMLLADIFGILTLGPRESMRYIGRLRDLVIAHHRLFVKLYPDQVRPKLHHAHHVVSSMKQLGYLLACFVTERKHKLVNQVAVHTFRNFEHTTLVDVLHQQCSHLASGHDLFQHELLVAPKHVHNHEGLATSAHVVCHVGEVHNKDIMCTKSGVIAKAESFWRLSDGPVHVRGQSLAREGADFALRNTRVTTPVCFEVADILSICTWCFTDTDRGIIKVRLPPSLLLEAA